jgi:hypothetical protein
VQLETVEKQVEVSTANGVGVERLVVVSAQRSGCRTNTELCRVRG